MAAPYPDQQAYHPHPQPYHQFPEGGYQPAPGQFPSQQDKPFPVQGQPPGYDYGGQPGYVGKPGYQPMPAPPPVTATTTTVVMTAQPTPVTTAYQAPPESDYSGMAVCALVFSIITLLCFGCSLFGLICSIPALILSIAALGSTGSSQKSHAGISIALNVTVVMCFLLFLAIFIPSYVVRVNSAIRSINYASSTRSCSSYYYSTYTLCIPNQYSVCRGCTCYFYSYSGGYCPSR